VNNNASLSLTHSQSLTVTHCHSLSLTVTHSLTPNTSLPLSGLSFCTSTSLKPPSKPSQYHSIPMAGYITHHHHHHHFLLRQLTHPLSHTHTAYLSTTGIPRYNTVLRVRKTKKSCIRIRARSHTANSHSLTHGHSHSTYVTL